jgi:hypothetical protein
VRTASAEPLCTSYWSRYGQGWITIACIASKYKHDPHRIVRVQRIDEGVDRFVSKLGRGRKTIWRFERRPRAQRVCLDGSKLCCSMAGGGDADARSRPARLAGVGGNMDLGDTIP